MKVKDALWRKGAGGKRGRGGRGGGGGVEEGEVGHNTMLLSKKCLATGLLLSCVQVYSFLPNSFLLLLLSHFASRPSLSLSLFRFCFCFVCL